ncbi:MAG: hypothetical protein HIU88_10955 [Acidobacteria bacterium]|nr:hypothetical protein [Acidobacteriota bacterium]
MAGTLIGALGVTIAFFRRPITRFLQIHYERTHHTWIARHISVWTTLAFAVLIFPLGVVLLLLALTGKITSG